MPSIQLWARGGRYYLSWSLQSECCLSWDIETAARAAAASCMPAGEAAAVMTDTAVAEPEQQRSVGSSDLGVLMGEYGWTWHWAMRREKRV